MMLSLMLAGLLLAGSAGSSRTIACDGGGAFVVTGAEGPDGVLWTFTLPDGTPLLRLDRDAAELFVPKHETISRDELQARYSTPCDLVRAARP